jgi:hypothetical protein
LQTPEDALSFCERSREGLRKKADHNKSEALGCFIVVISCTLAAPLFITLGSGFWLGKVLPSILSLAAAGATAWLQQRKPQQLWALYRGAQRELEDHETKRKYLIGEYEAAKDPDKLLAEKVAAIVLNVHYQWLPIVPSPDNLKTLESGKASHLSKVAPVSNSQ